MKFDRIMYSELQSYVNTRSQSETTACNAQVCIKLVRFERVHKRETSSVIHTMTVYVVLLC